MPDLGEIRVSGLEGITELNFNQAATYNVLATDTLANPHFFKKFEILKGGISPEQRIRFLSSHINVLVKRDSGTAAIRFGIFKSDDNITYTSHNESNTSNPAELALDGTVGRGFFDTSVNFLAFLVHNETANELGTIRQMVFNILFQLPPGYTIQELI